MRYTLPQVTKAIVAFVVTVATAIGTAAADGQVDLPEVAGLAGAVLAAWTVFKARNAPVAAPPPT